MFTTSTTQEQKAELTAALEVLTSLYNKYNSNENKLSKSRIISGYWYDNNGSLIIEGMGERSDFDKDSEGNLLDENGGVVNIAFSLEKSFSDCKILFDKRVHTSLEVEKEITK